AGTIETIPIATLVESILIVLVIPFVLAHLTRFLLRSRKSFLNNKIILFFDNSQIFFLSLAIMTMFASYVHYILEFLEVIYILTFPVISFFVIIYVVGRFA